MAQRRMTTPRVLCELRAWQWQVEGYVIAGVVHRSRTKLYEDGKLEEFLFEAVAQYPASYDGEDPYFLGMLKSKDYVKCYLKEKGTGDPLKSLFGGKSPDKGGSK